jgi:hypothetical protein
LLNARVAGTPQLTACIAECEEYSPWVSRFTRCSKFAVLPIGLPTVKYGRNGERHQSLITAIPLTAAGACLIGRQGSGKSLWARCFTELFQTESEFTVGSKRFRALFSPAVLVAANRDISAGNLVTALNDIVSLDAKDNAAFVASLQAQQPLPLPRQRIIEWQTRVRQLIHVDIGFADTPQPDGGLKRSWRGSIPDSASSVSISSLSDGQRSVAFLIAAVLRAQPKAAVIVDEPERHIESRIIRELLPLLLDLRAGARLVVLTHDLSAAVATGWDMLWMKSSRVVKNRVFDAPSGGFRPVVYPEWDVQLLPAGCPLPSPLILEVLGTHKPIVFVEGDEDKRCVIDLCFFGLLNCTVQSHEQAAPRLLLRSVARRR